MGEMMLGSISMYVEQVDTAHVHLLDPSCLYTEGFRVVVRDNLSGRVRTKEGSRGAVVPATGEA